MPAKPFYARLTQYYSDIGAVLRGEAQAASVFPNSTDIGQSRETVYAEILRHHLPSSCNVTFGGFLFGQAGDESKQLDIIVTDSSSLQYNFHRGGAGKSFACVDGCIAVVSVKSNLDSRELVDSLKNIASLPEKLPLGTRGQPGLNFGSYQDWPLKIIFAHEGVDPRTALQTLKKFYKQHNEIPRWRRPNLIHVAGKYVAMREDPVDGEGSDFLDAGEGINYRFCKDKPDLLGLLSAFQHIQLVALTSRHVLTTYTKMIEHIP